MILTDAIAYLRRGHRICRVDWSEGHFFVLPRGEGFQDHNGITAWLTLNDVCADDWLWMSDDGIPISDPKPDEVEALTLSLKLKLLKRLESLTDANNLALPGVTMALDTLTQLGDS